METYYEIINNIAKGSNSKYRNYNKLLNINFSINNELNKEIQNIINENEDNKIFEILKLYSLIKNIYTKKVEHHSKKIGEEQEKKIKEKMQTEHNSNNEKNLVLSNKIPQLNESSKHENHSMEELCQEQLKNKEVSSKKVINVMLEVDRADFAPRNYYLNRAQQIICNTTISAPHLHGYCLQALENHLKEGNRVLDVGFGSGYLTVALSKMMNDKGVVVGIEHINSLYDYGKKIYQSITKI